MGSYTMVGFPNLIRIILKAQSDYTSQRIMEMARLSLWQNFQSFVILRTISRLHLM
jgi:hypothetical protein